MQKIAMVVMGHSPITERSDQTRKQNDDKLKLAQVTAGYKCRWGLL